MIGRSCPTVGGLNMIKGEPVTIPSKGDVLCIECWATWCGPCRQVFPHLSQIARKYKAQGLKVVGVTQEAISSSLRQFVTAQGANMDYPVAVDGQQEVQELLMMPAGARGIPHAFLVDHNGIIQYSGHPADPMFEATVERLCAARQAAAKPRLVLTPEALAQASVKDIKHELQLRGVSYAGMTEKPELIAALLKAA